MLFLLLKNAKDSSLAESSWFDAGTGHTIQRKLSLLVAKGGGSHEMLISDVCHNYQF